MAIHFSDSIREELLDLVGSIESDSDAKRILPSLAKDRSATDALGRLAQRVDTTQRIVQGDARHLEFIPDETVHLVVTSPPYWTLKEYVSSEGQLGDVEGYDDFVGELARVWRQCHRVLVPGGRLIVVVGDVCLSRRVHGRHAVIPLHASIQESCRRIGFDNLAPIIWHKISNAKFESGGGGFLGKPYEPNAVIKNDIEFVLMQRKGGGYRRPTIESRLLSVIPEAEHRAWFTQIWGMGGASTRDHPAPYPVALVERLIRMFSFVGDTVLDPFLGSGTTLEGAARWGRSGLGVEIEPSYVQFAHRRLIREFDSLHSHTLIKLDRHGARSSSDAAR